MTRSVLYSLIAEGRIRSKTITKPGRARGIRLLYIPSIRAYIESFPDDQPAAVKPVAPEEGGAN